MKFLKPIEVQAGISDGDPTNPLGQAGYLLSSDGSNVNWISPGGLSAETAEAIVQPIKADGALAKGDPVYIVGYQSGQNVNIVAKADSSDAAKMPVVGLADDDYANDNFGTMTAFGSFNGDFDTTGGTENWAVGDIIFVKAGGGLTNVKPTGTDLIQNIAIVSRVQQNTGELEVIALGRTNDVPNLPTGRLFVGTAANTSLASDVIYVDDTNNRVGIGTTSPSEKLDVNGRTTSKGFRTYATNTDYNLLSRNSSGNATLYVQSVTSDTNQAIAQFNYGSATANAGQEVLLVAKDNSYFVNTNVGIGTTSPGSKLDINNDVQIDTYSAGTTIAHNAGYIKLLSDSKTGWAPGDELGKIEFYSKDTSGIGARNAASIRAVNNQGNGSSTTTFEGELAFYTSLVNTTEAEAVRIDSAGNVGIGTTSPQSKLQVDGGVQIADDTDAASADKVGTLRYRTSGNNSYVDMCMQTGATTYEWVNIVQNNW